MAKETIAARLPPATVKRLDELAAREGITRTQLLTRIVETHCFSDHQRLLAKGRDANAVRWIKSACHRMKRMVKLIESEDGPLNGTTRLQSTGKVRP
jgi:hypothetical protein